MKMLLIGIGLLPLVRLIVLGYQDDLTANPIEFITRSTGTWALVFLCLTLAITPLRRLTGINQLIEYRRTLGLLVFFYACLHFSIWFWLDHGLIFSEMINDVIKRPFITVGFISFVLLIPLALTSNQWAVKKLKRNWGRLHQLIYLIAPLVILHYFWHKSGKNDYFTVGIYGAVLLILLAFRLRVRLKQ
jgi:methionine sulfoxide reductase heme-binding subunit